MMLGALANGQSSIRDQAIGRERPRLPVPPQVGQAPVELKAKSSAANAIKWTPHVGGQVIIPMPLSPSLRQIHRFGNIKCRRKHGDHWDERGAQTRKYEANNVQASVAVPTAERIPEQRPLSERNGTGNMFDQISPRPRWFALSVGKYKWTAHSCSGACLLRTARPLPASFYRNRIGR